jgi:micrococcal nuclease
VTALVAIGLLGASFTLLGQGKKLTTVEAKNHVGEQATVCGKVASGHYAATTRGKPTFLDLDKPYPDQLFTVLIWGENRAKFGTPEETYRNKNICVTGRIESYRGEPEIVASDPAQLSTDSR